MASKNVETLRKAHESWNRRDFEATVSAMSENLTYTDHSRNLHLRSRNDFKNWATEWAKAFTDGKIMHPRYTDGGDTVVAEFTAEGTNDGPLGSLPASGRRMTLAFCEIFKFDASGRITSGRIYYDQFTLLNQLGHNQTRAAAG